MKAKYYQQGKTLDFTATEAVSNGDIVSLTTRIGVAGNDIAAGETGAVHVEGVFELPKAAEEIALGAAVYWSESAENITATAESNIPAGYAVAAAKAADTTVLVKLPG